LLQRQQMAEIAGGVDFGFRIADCGFEGGFFQSAI
jgi:hypothetical protein